MDAQSIEAFLREYSGFYKIPLSEADIRSTTPPANLLTVTTETDGSYVTQARPLPTNPVDHRAIVIVTEKLRRYAQSKDIFATPHLELSDGLLRVRGAEIGERIYAEHRQHAFDLYFKILPCIPVKKNPHWYGGTDIYAANHRQGAHIGHIMFTICKDEEGNIIPLEEPTSATFIHHGHKKEHGFFVQHRFEAAEIEGEQSSVYHLAGPIHVPKASLIERGSLQHLLETFEFS